MIVGDLKPLAEIVAAIKEYKQVLVLGCGSCVTVCLSGGEKEAELAAAAETLRDTRVTQPAVLAVDVALARLLDSYGIVPDMVIGHSLGEYAALVAAGALDFGEALRVVSARGREMSRVSQDDNGRMAAVWASLDEVEQILAHVWGYDFGGEDNVLEVYIGYLRKKLEEGGAPRLIQTVRGVGYVLREE